MLVTPNRGRANGLGCVNGWRMANGQALLDTPLSIAGLQAGYSPELSRLWQTSARATLAQADADNVGAVDDFSGNGRNQLQATAGKRFVLKLAIKNGRPVLRSDATQWTQYTTSTGCTSACHWFIVVKPSSVSSTVPLGVGASAAGQIFTAFLNTNFIAAGGSGATDTSSGIAASTLTFQLFEAAYDGATAFTWVNGVAGATKSVSVTMSGTIGLATNTDGGGGQLCGGDYCIALLFNRPLSVVERKLQRAYINRRLGLF